MADEGGEVLALKTTQESVAEKEGANAPDVSTERKAKKMGWFHAAVERAKLLMARREGEGAFGEAVDEAKKRMETEDIKGAADIMIAANKENDERREDEKKKEDNYTLAA